MAPPPSLRHALMGDGGKDLKEKITYAIRQIEIQRKELDQLRLRLEERRKSIFGATVRAIEQCDEMRARLLSGEHVELQKVTHIVNAAELALLHIVVRLETLRDVGDIMYVLTNAFKEVKRVGKSISNIAPNLERAAEEINQSFSDILAELGILSPEVRITLSDTPQEIFDKAHQLIKEKTSQISDLPKSLEQVENSQEGSLFEKTKKIALLATLDGDNGDEQEEEEEEEKLVGVKVPEPAKDQQVADLSEEQFKPILLSVRSPPQQTDVDYELRRYIAEHGEASFDVIAASARLNLPVYKIEESYLRILDQRKRLRQTKEQDQEGAEAI